MSKASDRIYNEWQKEGTPGSPVSVTLAKIRARRDEILAEWHESAQSTASNEFALLFDDGAEFGPDKPEPKAQGNLEEQLHFLQDHCCRQHDRIEFLEELNRDLGKRLDDAVKKLGAEGASNEA